MNTPIIRITEASHPNLMEVLVSNGYRATASRKAIAGLLHQEQKGFTAEAISKELTSVSRATVYRTINLFLDAGVVCKLANTDGVPWYIICRVGHPCHSVCIQCGAVEEPPGSAVEKITGAISADIPGQVIDHLFEVYLMCDYCSTNT